MDTGWPRAIGSQVNAIVILEWLLRPTLPLATTFESRTEPAPAPQSLDLAADSWEPEPFV